MSNEISVTTKPGLIDRVGEKVEPRLRSVLRRIPSRVSLLTGAVFVLVTLYLPLAVDSCGDYSGRGIDIAAGKEGVYWPSYTAFALDEISAGRWFYFLLLGWAFLALLLALFSLGPARGLARGALPQPFSVVACAVSLILLADYFVFSLGVLDPVVDWLTGKSDFAEACLYFGVFLLAAASCLRAKAVRHDLPVALPFILACAALVCGAALEPYASLRGTGSNFEDLASWLFLGALLVGYFLGPLLVWLRLGSPSRSDRDTQWPRTRRRLALALVPAVAGQFWAAYSAIFEAHVWGLIPCLAGIHLITLGYMRLAQQAEAARAPTIVPATRPAIAGP